MSMSLECRAHRRGRGAWMCDSVSAGQATVSGAGELQAEHGWLHALIDHRSTQRQPIMCLRYLFGSLLPT